ncbi:MAG TPA: proton-conducting transporter membrane subunit [Pedococcus sp.]|nr:proton-conducting transporter membrane subunit [Pedococcus sp.]
MTTLVSIDALALGPVLAPALGAALVLLVDVVAPRLRGAHAAVGAAALVVGLASGVPGALGTEGDPVRTLCLPAPAGACFYEAGALASALQLGALASALVVLLLVWPSPMPEGDELRGGPAVLVALVLSATAGATAVAAAHDLGSWLVALELATLPAIALVALRGTRRAGAGALSLLTTSLVSFAMVVLGAALWLVGTGEAVFSSGAVQRALETPEARAVLLLGVLLLVGGLGFKLSLVPFHAWTPQTYAGASEPVAAFLAATSKIAALAALVVVLRPVADASGPVLVAVGVLAAVSMTVGNVLALVQDDPVRLLAWSTVAQAGWVVLPLATLVPDGLAASGGYVLAYAIATLVAFTVVTMVGQAAPGAAPAGRSLAAYRGLMRRNPVVAGLLGLALVSLAGLPPGVIGLVAKVLALRPVVSEGLWALALVAVANAVIGVAVYLRWFAVLLQEPAADSATLRRPAAGPAAALALTGTALVLTSLAPQLLLGLVD